MGVISVVIVFAIVIAIIIIDRYLSHKEKAKAWADLTFATKKWILAHPDYLYRLIPTVEEANDIKTEIRDQRLLNAIYSTGAFLGMGIDDGVVGSLGDLTLFYQASHTANAVDLLTYYYKQIMYVNDLLYNQKASLDQLAGPLALLRMFEYKLYGKYPIPNARSS